MDVRHEALLMLDKRGAILDTAREVSRILKQKKVRGAVIGGVAVVLHGHIRTTKDVDVYVAEFPTAAGSVPADASGIDAAGTSRTAGAGKGDRGGLLGLVLVLAGVTAVIVIAGVRQERQRS